MAAKAKNEATEALKQLTYLASALKAPRITEAASRLAEISANGKRLTSTQPLCPNPKGLHRCINRLGLGAAPLESNVTAAVSWRVILART